MNRYFATVARGLETIAAKELENLGATQVTPDFTGVHFEGDRSLLYRVNLWARTIFRVLVPIAEFPCRDADALYRGVQNIEWSDYLSPEQTLAVRCTGGNSKLNHTHYSALQVKNAIVDQQRRQFGKRSSVDSREPDLQINAHIYGDQCILSLDSSGDSLHRRGYRPAMGIAPLKETLAAALLELAEYDPNLPFVDPMCGSGTLPLEASLKALKIAPGLFRDQFAFMNWQDFDRSLWRQLCQEALEGQLDELPAPIWGSDRERAAIDLATTNASNCGVADFIQLKQMDFSQLEAPGDRGILICNPPYGERLGNTEELGGLYKQLGDTFKQRFKGWTAFILTGNKELAKRVGLRASRRFPVENGAIACTLLKYELY
ncbi:MAG TPA: RNA methyltransferase [Oscillatoriales cyanobacterium M59_W2019_021]|nr:MAG: RNA methyltransferase [Cyanobacteria bacterium J055]HIK33420.1 RNA methyltransferase [Oscillatoriales cyanobacterium M4454_W2019_049]HIK49843.1 RNA methyltransferase [Oscillatoriales cyanobacterium M59_W2019_021]